MAKNAFNWHSERNRPRQVASMYESDSVSKLQAQVVALIVQLSRIQPMSSVGPSHMPNMDSIPHGSPPMSFSYYPMGDSYFPSSSASM